jgi:UDP-N-acetylglucosamine 2-epimerase (non-hydrolysing)
MEALKDFYKDKKILITGSSGFVGSWLSLTLKELDVDVYEVIRLANRHPRVNVLTPGPGVGGHCIPIDPWFLVENTESGEFVRLARAINDQRPSIVAQQTLDLLMQSTDSLVGKKVGILGVAYKANVDDCRESPADAIHEHFIKAGVVVNYHDPFVPNWHCDKQETLTDIDEWADVLILVTDHECYNNLTLLTPLLNTRA